MRKGTDRGAGCLIAGFVIVVVLIALVGEIAGYDMIRSTPAIPVSERGR